MEHALVTPSTEAYSRACLTVAQASLVMCWELFTNQLSRGSGRPCLVAFGHFCSIETRVMANFKPSTWCQLAS